MKKLFISLLLMAAPVLMFAQSNNVLQKLAKIDNELYVIEGNQQFRVDKRTITVKPKNQDVVKREYE
jgi:hypothetical protein